MAEGLWVREQAGSGTDALHVVTTDSLTGLHPGCGGLLHWPRPRALASACMVLEHERETPTPDVCPLSTPSPAPCSQPPLVRAAFGPEWLSPRCRNSLENKGFLAVLTVSEWYFPHTLPGSRPARPGSWLLLSTPRPLCKWQGEAVSLDGVRRPESSASWGDGSLGTSPIVQPCIQPGGNP